jgi:serine phosphatase RsbU (regulator of sigma subunit)
MYSDGVVECQAPDGGMFGVEGVQRWLEAWRDGPGDLAVEDLYRRLEAFRRSATPEDDITMLYVRRPRG